MNPAFPQLWVAPHAPNQAFKACQPIEDSLTELNGNARTTCLEFNSEWTEFLISRLQQGMSLVRDFAKCSEPGAAFGVYSAFFAKAISDYQSESARLVALNSKCIEQTTRAVQVATSNVGHAMPAAA